MPAMPQPYRTPMDNPEYRRQFLERQIRQQQQQQQRSAEDPSYQILLEMQRRKLAGQSPEGAAEAGMRNAQTEQYLNRPGGLLDEIYSGSAPRVGPSPASPGNPFAHEPQEYQDMMRRLGVIQ
jgi:hypothetical protein